MSATSQLCDAAVAAINAAIADNTITRPISVREGYVVNRPLEESEGVIVIVKPGRPDRNPSTLDGANLETLLIRVLVESKVRSTEPESIKPLLDLVELVQDEIQIRIPSHDFIFVTADPEDDGAFDEDKLRYQNLFYSLTVMEFEKLRQVA